MAASSQTDAFAVSQGNADTEFNASDEAFSEWGREFCIVFVITSLATTRFKVLVLLQIKNARPAREASGDR